MIEIEKYKKNELENCNTIKIIMMLAVLIYHSCALWGPQGWFNQEPRFLNKILELITIWLGSIHIYTFTFVSGYIFYYIKYEKKRYNNKKRDIIKRFKRLIIPYISTAVFWCIPFYIFYFNADFKEIIKKYFLLTSPSQLWFLIMLFGVFIIFILVSDKINKLSGIHTIVLALSIFIIYLILKFLNMPNIFQIVSITRHTLFFLLGFMFRKMNFKKLYDINFLVWPIINILAFFIYLELCDDRFLISNLAYLLMSISGIFIIVLGVNKYLYNIDKNSKLYKFLEKNNFVIYLFHQQLIYISIDLFNSKVNSYQLVILNLMVSIIGSVIISNLLSKNKITMLLFGIE